MQTGNSKTQAWDSVAGSYWREQVGEPPNEEMLQAFFSGISEDDNVAVIGASSYNMVSQLQTICRNIEVIDFSQHMLDELGRDLPPGCRFIKADITDENTISLAQNTYDFILSDRLLNRIPALEIPNAIRCMLALLRHDGEIRSSVRFGFYDSDLRALALLKNPDEIRRFLDPYALEVDYSKLPPSVANKAVGHEARARLYVARGCEKRFTVGELSRFINKSADGQLHVEFLPISEKPSDQLLCLRSYTKD